ncbi:hypothetical protein KSI01_20470 [Kurthia sibirica]|nr:hypothetical protein KSI01_20470 [Kurthia sibirica]
MFGNGFLLQCQLNEKSYGPLNRSIALNILKTNFTYKTNKFPSAIKDTLGRIIIIVASRPSVKYKNRIAINTYKSVGII